MRYIFYTFWKLLRLIKTNDTPATNALILITVCQLLNIQAAYFMFNLYAKVNLVDHSNSTVIFYIIFIGLLLIILNYFFIYRKRDLLANKYKNEAKNQKAFRRLLVLLYFFGTFILVFYFGIKSSV